MRFPFLKCYLDISTHTLTWSVTVYKVREMIFQGHFNSHAHVERDNLERKNGIKRNISTHTLTWSVTLTGITEIKEKAFQLTRSRGA